MIVWHLQVRAGAVFFVIDIIQHIDIIQLMKYDRKKISIRGMLYAVTRRLMGKIRGRKRDGSQNQSINT